MLEYKYIDHVLPLSKPKIIVESKATCSLASYLTLNNKKDQICILSSFIFFILFFSP